MILSLFSLAVTAAVWILVNHSDSVPHQNEKGIYFWRTKFDLDSTEIAFLKNKQINRLYIRFFDVSLNPSNNRFAERVIPNATIHFEESDSTLLSFDDMKIIAVVYITTDALREMKGKEERLAKMITRRVEEMSRAHSLNVAELQLDCDWTPSTKDSFFKLCRETRRLISADENTDGTEGQETWSLSSTIRLHQLSGEAPPVDSGVLMLYNTGDFSDPDTRNSILSFEDVEPYLKYLPDYSLKLDAAYPDYSWELLFRAPSFEFGGLLRHSATTGDNAQHVAATGRNNSYRALERFLCGTTEIGRGDIVRVEKSEYSEIIAVKSAVDKALGNSDRCNIIYHLDSKNLNNFSSDEIDRIFH